MSKSRRSVDIVIPVLNEERALPVCVERLRTFLSESLSNPWRIVIADNGSDDRTEEIGRTMAAESTDIKYIRLEQRGRGRALKKAWLERDADFLSYMDVDLSTDINAIPLMVASLEEGCHLAVGSRLAAGAKVYRRTIKREITSRGYNMLIKAMFFNRFSDAQCGFKSITSEAARLLVPRMVDNAWFFDTELLLVAEKRGFHIKDIAVTWTDDPDTRVKIAKTVWEDIKGLCRLRFGGLPRISVP